MADFVVLSTEIIFMYAEYNTFISIVGGVKLVSIVSTCIN